MPIRGVLAACREVRYDATHRPNFAGHVYMTDRYPHPATLDETALLSDCRMRRLRRSGPGGQHRNKVETGVVLTHEPTGVSAEATERRSQGENRRVALRRLKINLALNVRQAIGDDQPPSPLWQSRCRKGRIGVNPEHQGFPSLLAEAIDSVAASEWDVSAAAGRLGCTASQLIKLLKLEPRAFLQLNQQRSELGLRRLK